MIGAVPDRVVLAEELADEVVDALTDEVLLERSDASDDEALDKMLEYSEGRDVETLESVAVAAMLESSELSDEARLESALEAAAVAEEAALEEFSVLVMLDVSDLAEEATLEASDATEDTTLEGVPVAVSRMPVELEVLLNVAAVTDAVLDFVL